MRHCKLDGKTCKALKKSIKEFVFNGSKRVGKNEIIHSKIAKGGWGLRCIEVTWTQLLMRWTLRALKMENTTTLENLRDYMETKHNLDTRDPESSGHGKTVKKSKIYESE